jgi:tight adherence protein C
MPLFTLLTLAAVFIAVAAFAGLVTAALLSTRSAELQRLRAITQPAAFRPLPEVRLKTDQRAGGPRPGATIGAGEAVGTRKKVGRLEQRLIRAGFPHPAMPYIYTLLEFGGPIAGAIAAYVWLQPSGYAYFAAAGAAIVLYFAPGFYVDHRLAVHRRQIQNGLPDLLDLLVVCIEAGSGLDQALVKAADELGLAYPTLTAELRILISELRAGKPRVEAFKSLAVRTKVDDVRALVAMLVQTDKFGTSVGQALRTHADASRDRRRQRAEERAQKIAVKLVFPLVLCFFPALYVVILGPVVIMFSRTFGH